MAYVKLVKGDNQTIVTAQIENSQTRGPENLSTSQQVRMHFRRAASVTPLVTIPGELIAGYETADGDMNLVDYPTPGEGGRVQFSFPVGALDIDAGNYEGAVEILYVGGSSQTVYDLILFLVRE